MPSALKLLLIRVLGLFTNSSINEKKIAHLGHYFEWACVPYSFVISSSMLFLNVLNVPTT